MTTSVVKILDIDLDITFIIIANISANTRHPFKYLEY